MLDIQHKAPRRVMCGVLSANPLKCPQSTRPMGPFLQGLDCTSCSRPAPASRTMGRFRRNRRECLVIPVGHREDLTAFLSQ